MFSPPHPHYKHYYFMGMALLESQNLFPGNIIYNVDRLRASWSTKLWIQVSFTNVGVENKISKHSQHLHYMIDHFGPAIKPQSLTREDEIYSLNKELPSLYNYKFSFLTDVWEWKRRFLKNGQGLTTFCLSPKAIIRQKSWNLQFMFPLTQKYIVHMYFI